jgi:hypothetical protein
MLATAATAEKKLPLKKIKRLPPKALIKLPGISRLNTRVPQSSISMKTLP